MMPDFKLFAGIKLLVSDFDGVFTDNRVVVSEDGKESVTCSRADGLGVELLKKNGMDIIVISKERNAVVQARCRKMGITDYSGVEDKLTLLKAEMVKRSLAPDEVCYIGNDINDVECLAHVQGVAVADAYDRVKDVVKYVTEKPGGHGAVRELAELLLRARGK